MLVGFKIYNIGNLYFALPQIVTVVSAVVLMVVLTIFVRRARIGKAMRATSFDREAASMMGIDVDRVISITFFIGSALAGAAGVMFGLVFGQIFNLMGFLAGLKGFTAAVIGGIGSIPGAMIGGLVLGLLEAYATGYLPQGSTFHDLYVFIAADHDHPDLRPSGMLGKPGDPEGLMHDRARRSRRARRPRQRWSDAPHRRRRVGRRSAEGRRARVGRIQRLRGGARRRSAGSRLRHPGDRLPVLRRTRATSTATASSR